MDLTSPKAIKEILEKYEKRPSKGLGQNFLIDKNILQKIIKPANLKKEDTVLEIGPGLGTLTQELAKNAGKVIAIEKDKTMCEILRKTLAEFKNVEIINADVLKLKNFKLNSNLKFQISNYKVVANLPYYITSPVIRMFLESENPPNEMVLMLQKEVAQRICEKPGNMSLLAVSVQFYAKPEIISYVSKNCFWPSPKVDSAVIKITPFKANSKFKIQNSKFFTIVKAGFLHPRKQLAPNLAKELKFGREAVEAWLAKNNISPTQRAETLSIQDWQNLAKSFSIKD
jgi:16S rRNA (adenine1518-N6/adenine1519-N6)-dimethyltransferase